MARPGRSGCRQEILRVFGSALNIRHVDAGSCNGCELEIHAVNNRLLQHRRSGHQIRRQPAPCRHAAGHRPGVARTWKSRSSALMMPRRNPSWWWRSANAPAMAGSFAPEAAAKATRAAAKSSNVIPVDVAVSGCPPTPTAIMQGILTAISSKKSISLRLGNAPHQNNRL